MDRRFHRAMAGHIAFIQMVYDREMQRLETEQTRLIPELLAAPEPLGLVAPLHLHAQSARTRAAPELRLVWSK